MISKSKPMQINMAGHEITNQEVLDDSKAKALAKPFKISLRSVGAIYSMLTFRNLKKYTNYRPEFNVDFEKASARELFNVLCFQVEKITPGFQTHLPGGIASVMYNCALFSFLASKFKDGKRDIRLND